MNCCVDRARRGWCNCSSAQPPPKPSTGPFLKHDSGKPRMDLLPPEALVEIARVLSYGAEKYQAHNWRKATNWGRYTAASLRHITSWLGGEDVDAESGLPHLAHAACCLMFLIALQETGVGTDDRY